LGIIRNINSNFSKNMKKVIYGLMSFAPVLALAQGLSGLETIVDDMQSILAKVVPLLFGLAIAWFFWGVIKFIRSAGDPKATADAKGTMIYGVIAIAVMASVYGLVTWLGNTLGVDTGGTIDLPDLPTQ
jgi:branched-subunit amino acid permease